MLHLPRYVINVAMSSLFLVKIILVLINLIIDKSYLSFKIHIIKSHHYNCTHTSLLVVSFVYYKSGYE